MAQLRVYTRSLSQDEIQWDMQEDNQAKRQFRTAYPIDFRLENADTQPVLLLDSSTNGQDMTLSISNRARAPIQVVAKSGPASSANFHFALQFRPGTLAQINRIALASASQDGWSLQPQPGQAGQADCLYLLQTRPLAMAVGSEVVLVFQQVMADGAAGTRGTRVLLRYSQLQMAGGESISGTREQYLDIVYAHGSQPNMPFSYDSGNGEITVQGKLKSQDDQPLQVVSSLQVAKDLIVNGTKLDVKSIPKIKTDSNFDVDLDAIPTVKAIVGLLQTLGLYPPQTIDLGNNIILEMVFIPGGTFAMGSDDGAPQEKPVHLVTVPPFYMGKYPVTQEQYQAIVGRNPASFQGDVKRPIEQVSWDEATDFCNRLSQKTKNVDNPYRLPSEAEWEYACRAGTSTKYYFGNDENKLGDFAWYGENSSGMSHPVGQKRPNPFGLYDMHGNVLEWCEDGWHDSYQGAPIDGSTWNKDGNSDNRLLRGGSWHYVPRFCRSASRDYNAAGIRFVIGGFRVVCAASRTF